jgi:hypothetical protein
MIKRQPKLGTKTCHRETKHTSDLTELSPHVHSQTSNEATIEQRPLSATALA